MPEQPETNVIEVEQLVTHYGEREVLKGVDLQVRQGEIMVIMGGSGSGKTTLAYALENTLFNRGCRTFVLDGDNVRHGLNRDLGFSAEDRQENVRRVAAAARHLAQAGAGRYPVAAVVQRHRRRAAAGPDGRIRAGYCRPAGPAACR